MSDIAMPMFYNYMNAETTKYSPSTIHASDNQTAQYFRRYLLQKAIAVFKWKMPEHWVKEYFLYTLYSQGFIAIINTNKFGVIPQRCALSGYNVMEAPTQVIVNNYLIRFPMSPTIGINCVLIKLMPDYGSILDKIEYYAAKMALVSEAIDINLLNTRLTTVFGADTKGAAESLKKVYDQVSRGEPAVFTDQKFFNADGKPKWAQFTQDAKQNYIVTDLLSDLRKIEAQFATDIGIPNANTDKRERLITDEVNANSIETKTLCELWLEELQKSCKQASTMFGIELSVDWRNNPDEQPQPVKEATPNDG